MSIHNQPPLQSGTAVAMDCPINDSLFAFPEPDAMTVNEDYAQPDIGYEQLELARSIQLALDPSTYILDSRNAVDPIMRGQSASAEEELLLKKALTRLRAGETVTLAKGEPIHIGIDSEYVYDPKTKRNVILSYQFHVITELGSHSGIIYPKSGKVSDRLEFDPFIARIVIMCKEKGIITKWPKKIYVYAHFLRADLASFSDFFRKKTKVSGIRKTVTTMTETYGVDIKALLARRAQPEPMILKDSQRKKHMTLIAFVDTMLHTPGGTGLATVGEMIGIPKLSIPDGYSIERMDELLAGDKSAFEAYALRDAEIAVKYGLRLHEFIKQHGLTRLPASLGSLSCSMFLKFLRDQEYDQHQLLGTEVVERSRWNDKESRLTSQKLRQMTSLARTFEPLAIDCYHGGRNESYWNGPTPVSSFYDFDLSGAYTTALVDLFPLDYGNARLTSNPEDYRGHVLGLARVRFSFPTGLRFPCLPVFDEKYGLLYPLSGESNCTAPEIEVALNMGCQIDIIQGIIIPWCDVEVSPFESFVSFVRKMRKSYTKKSCDELLWKEIGNSVYGKLAQGLQGKTAFDTTTGLSKKIDRSAITNAYFAAHTTGIVRAVLSEILAAIPANKTVISATTDGLLTDATYEELDLSGPLCRRFQALGERLDGDSFRMLELKHGANQLIAMKTRGQLTAIPMEGQPDILAKAGVKPPCSKDQHQNYMLDLYLNRTPGQKVDSEQLVSISEMWINECDLVSMTKTKTLNLEFDFKRKPMQPSMQSVLGIEHICFETQPWPTAQAAIEERIIFDSWRKNHCLKTLEDWENWEDYLTCKGSMKSNVMRMTDEGSLGILKRVFLRAYTQSAFGMTKTMGYSELAEWLTINGCPTSVDDCKSAKRAKLVGQCVPVTTRTVRLVRVILQECPGIDLGALFKPEDMPQLQGRLNNPKTDMAKITLDAPSHEVITD